MVINLIEFVEFFGELFGNEIGDELFSYFLWDWAYYESYLTSSCRGWCSSRIWSCGFGAKRCPGNTPWLIKYINFQYIFFRSILPFIKLSNFFIQAFIYLLLLFFLIIRKFVLNKRSLIYFDKCLLQKKNPSKLCYYKINKINYLMTRVV